MAIRNLKITVVDGGKSNRRSSSKSGDSENKKNAKDSPLYKVLNAKDTIKDKLQSGMSSSTSENVAALRSDARYETLVDRLKKVAKKP